MGEVFDREMERKVFGELVSDIGGCLGLMRKHGAIGCGSSVVRSFFDECEWENREMYFFMGGGMDFGWRLREWNKFLVGEGYGVVDSVGFSYGEGRVSEDRCVRFEKLIVKSVRFKDDKRGSVLKLYCVEGNAFVCALGKMWSTVVVSFATSECVYCCFPDMSIQRRCMVVVERMSEEQDKAVSAYRERGFQILGGSGIPSLEVMSIREVGDSHCRVVMFSEGDRGRESGLFGVRFSFSRNGVIVYNS